MKTAKDVTFNGRHKLPAMEENYQASAVQYAQWRIEKELRDHDPMAHFPDPEEIRALTRHMRREAWQPPKIKASEQSARARAILVAYLEEWGDMKLGELERFGISALAVGRMASSLPVRRVRPKCLYGSVFLVLERGRAE